MPLKLIAIGGLGNMLGPSAKHLQANKVAQYLRVLDRGTRGEKQDKYRQAWREHQATLVSNLSELIGDGDFDGVVICAGKNGDDMQIFCQLLAELSKQKKRNYFILHFSTISCDFAKTTYEYCAKHGVEYANYPLTGGAKGADAGTMLILCSGSTELYARVEPMLLAIGKPKYFGADVTLASAVKLIGHVLVFHGLLGVSLAVNLHKQVLGLSGLEKQQVEFFDFLNQGAGGSKQWDVAVRPGLAEDQWSHGFLLQHAVIDGIYTAQLMWQKQLPVTMILPILEVVLLQSYILQHYEKKDLTSQMVAYLIANTPKEKIDQYLRDNLSFDIEKCLQNCVASLPEQVRGSLLLEVNYGISL